MAGLNDKEQNPQGAFAPQETDYEALAKESRLNRQALLNARNAAQSQADVAEANMNKANEEYTAVQEENQKTLRDYIDQYKPMETPEQTAAREKRENSRRNIAYIGELAKGITNLVTATGHGRTAVKSPNMVDAVNKGNEADYQRKYRNWQMERAAEDKKRDAALRYGTAREQVAGKKYQNAFSAHQKAIDNVGKYDKMISDADAKADALQQKREAQADRKAQWEVQNALRATAQALQASNMSGASERQRAKFIVDTRNKYIADSNKEYDQKINDIKSRYKQSNGKYRELNAEDKEKVSALEEEKRAKRDEIYSAYDEMLVSEGTGNVSTASSKSSLGIKRAEDKRTLGIGR